MKLILVRHGSTVEIEKGMIHGVLHGRLSEEGIRQANAVARKLEKEKIDIIYSSDLRRARQTAKIIAKYHDCPLILSKNIRERNYGVLEGKKREENKKVAGYPENIPKGESLEQMKTRAKKFLDKLLSKHKKENVLVVAHNRINHAMISVIKNKPAKHIYQQKRQGHDEIIRFTI